MDQLLIVVWPLVLMMFVSSITPGPNNLMLMLAGTRFGLARTLPQIVGVSFGCMLVICLTFAGLGTLMLGHPRIVDTMTLACGAYLAWMAWHLLAPPPAAPRSEPAHTSARPMRIHEAMLFQFVNPKVWMMAVAATSIVARFPFSPLPSAALLALVTVSINFPCVTIWAAFGKALRHQLENPRNRRRFDGAMALLVVVTALWIVRPVFAG